MDDQLIQQVLSYFQFNIIEIIILSLFLILFIVQVYFYIRYYRKPFNFADMGDDRPSIADNSTRRYPMVSVIISSENEADNLAINLPLILEQDYPNFEVIVINDGSTDETDTLLQSLKLRYSHLYQTFLPLSNDKQFGRHKLALTIGIKAAKGEVLLFTEPYCRPISNQWMKRLAAKISDKTDVVLGYSYYIRTNSFYNRVARFDNHLFSMQYLSKAIIEKPFTGTYRNVAFKKQLFFDNKGFSSHLNIENGEDLFINHIVNNKNTEVSLSQDSFIETSLNSFALWQQIKKNYSIARSCFKNHEASVFSVEAGSRYLFYLLFIGSIVYSSVFQQWAMLAITILLFLIRFSMQVFIMNKSTQYFHSGRFYFSIIIMDIIQPVYNLFFKTRPRQVNGRHNR